MNKAIILLTLLITFAINSYADHGPRIQFINNSAAESMASVDLWVGFGPNIGYPATKLISDFDYKEASEFTTFSLIYGDLYFYITPAGSTDLSNILFQKTFGAPEINYEETFVVVIAGDPGNGLDMYLTDGRETPLYHNSTSVKIFHGSVGAPAINIEELSIPAGSLVQNLSFGEADGYLDLDAYDYELQIQTTNGIGVAEFSVPLSLLPNQALFVTATGYLDTTGTTPNNPFKLLAVTTAGNVIEIDPNQTLTPARLQIIHNSASASAASVDVWITDLDGSTKVLAGFGYKEATPYIDAPGGSEFTVSITGPGSIDTTNAVLHKNFILNSSMAYALVAAGDPGNNFDLFATEGSEEITSSGNTDVKVFHGSVGAPEVDIDEVGIPAGIIADNLEFGEFQGYLDLASIDYDLQIKTQTGIGAAEFSVPLSGFADSVLIVLASGYLDTTGTTPNNPFKLIAVTPSGVVEELNPNPFLTHSHLQIIHNSAMPAADSVDVYLDGMLIADNFAFRNSTSFLDVPGAKEFIVDIAAKTSTDNSNPLYSESFILASGREYIVVASGLIVFGGETYDPFKEFDLIPIIAAREEAMDVSMVDVMVFHGSTDAPMVDINELTLPVNELVNDIEYGMSQGYFELNPGAYELEILTALTGDGVKTYSADISSLAGEAITIVASGFISPDSNNNESEFGLWVSTAAGGEMLQLQEITPNSIEDSFNDEIDFRVFPNPTTDYLTIDGIVEATSVKVFSMIGTLVLNEEIQPSQRINLTGLPVGSYIVQFEMNNIIKNKKINKI